MNKEALQKDYEWFERIVKISMETYFEDNGDSIYKHLPPVLVEESLYTQIIKGYNMTIAERIILLLALAPHIIPHALDIFFMKNKTYDRDFSEFGGVLGKQHKGFLPTGETACFILAGNDFSRRLEVQKLFSEDHFFSKAGILSLQNQNSSEPLLSGQLVMSTEFIHYFTQGTEYHPKFGPTFPAERLTTKMDWSDLILPDLTMEEVKDILGWLKYNDTLMQDWGMHRKLKRGFRTLFYGPPGTGKTLTASLLGKQMGMDVYRIDLSQVVSKYIGETEKNMGSLFDQAENKKWILFFDEADALFGSRSATSDSKDRYANQEVAYLLQRVEDYPGVVILASNLKSNIDEAFARRFQSMILFPMPNVENRHRLWKSIFSDKAVFAPDVDLFDIAEEYELAGGAIINVVRYASMKTISRNTNVVELNDILQGIKRELKKEGKTISI